MKGIIFDFNGTLIFDREAHEASWHKLIPEIRGYGFTEEEFKEHVHGRTNREIFSYVLGKELTEEESEEYSEQKESLYRTFLVADSQACRLVYGLEAFFDLLKANAVPMAIATASPYSNLAFYIKQFHLDRWFTPERMVYADGTMHGKPNPAIFLRAIERLGLPAADCVVFEDTPLGVRAALAAGVKRVVGIWAEQAVLDELEKLPLYQKIQNYCDMNMDILL